MKEYGWSMNKLCLKSHKFEYNYKIFVFDFSRLYLLYFMNQKHYFEIKLQELGNFWFYIKYFKISPGIKKIYHTEIKNSNFSNYFCRKKKKN